MRIKQKSSNRHRKYRPNLLLIVIPLSILILWGCAFPPAYTYESIRKEYSRPTSHASVPENASNLITDGRRLERGIPATLTLAEAIEIASENNPDLMQATWRIEQAKAMRAIADAAFRPHLSVYTEYIQGDAPSAYLFKKIDQRMLPADVDFNQPGWFQNFESGIKGEMNLFNGFQDYWEIQMAEADIAISRSQRVRMHNDLTAEVIKTFYTALAAGEFIGIAEASVDTASKQLEIMRVRYEGGAVFKSDLFSLEVRLAEAREQLVSSRNRFELTRAALANLMGLDAAALSDADAALVRTEDRMADLPDGYEAGLLSALAQRPELAQARQQVVKTRMGVAAARGSYLPRLDLKAGYYLSDPTLDYNLERDNWTAALVLNWEIFSGFSRSARVNKANAMVNQMLAADRKAILQVQLDVKRSYLNLEEAVSRYTVAQSSLESAEASFHLVREHYQGGMVTITRYLEAELARNRALIRSTAAYYDQIKAHADVARAIGIWALETKIRE